MAGPNGDDARTPLTNITNNEKPAANPLTHELVAVELWVASHDLAVWRHRHLHDQVAAFHLNGGSNEKT